VHDFQVININSTTEKFYVNLLRRSCDCRKWLLTGLPCCHAISCMKNQDMDINEFVPDIFKKDQYAACYAPIIYPANGQNLWERTEYNDLQAPPIRKQPGRPKKKRNKEAGELLRDDGQMRRARYGIKCSRCKESGHNKSTCKLPPPQQTEGESTQTVNTTNVQASETNASQATEGAQATTNGQASQTNTSQGPQATQRTTQATTRHGQSSSGQTNTQPSATQGTSATSAQNRKTRKRKQKELQSSTQPEAAKGKKKNVSARTDGAASTQQ
jgi:hypothetical protein